MMKPTSSRFCQKYSQESLTVLQEIILHNANKAELVQVAADRKKTSQLFHRIRLPLLGIITSNCEEQENEHGRKWRREFSFLQFLLAPWDDHPNWIPMQLYG